MPLGFHYIPFDKRTPMGFYSSGHLFTNETASQHFIQSNFSSTVPWKSFPTNPHGVICQLLNCLQFVSFSIIQEKMHLISFSFGIVLIGKDGKSYHWWQHDHDDYMMLAPQKCFNSLDILSGEAGVLCWTSGFSSVLSARIKMNRSLLPDILKTLSDMERSLRVNHP